MPKVKFTQEVMDSAVTMIDHGMSAEGIAKILHMSRPAIVRFRTFLKKAREGDLDYFAKLDRDPILSNYVLDLVGLKLPEKETEEPVEKAPEETPVQLPIVVHEPPAVDDRADRLIDAIRDMVIEQRATRDAMEVVAAAIGRMNGLLANIELALKTESKTTRDFINANCDILFHPIEDIGNVLTGIARAVKKG